MNSPEQTRKIQYAAIAVLLIIVGFFVIKNWETIPSLSNIFSRKPLVIEPSAIIVREIKDIAQLMSVETYNEVVIDSVKYPGWGIPEKTFKKNPALATYLNLPRIVLVVKGRVIAGMDLKQLTPNHVSIYGDSISIILPKVQILDVITNPSNTETFFEKGKWTPEEITQVKLKAKEKVVQDALALNVLQRAETKSRETIETLLRNAGYRKVTIVNAQPLQ